MLGLGTGWLYSMLKLLLGKKATSIFQLIFYRYRLFGLSSDSNFMPFLQIYFSHLSSAILLLPLEIIRIRFMAQSIQPSEMKFSSLWFAFKNLFIQPNDPREVYKLHWRTSILFHSCLPLFKLFPVLLLKLFFPHYYANPFVQVALLATSHFVYHAVSLPLDLLRKRYYLEARVTDAENTSTVLYPIIPYVSCLRLAATSRPLYYPSDTWQAIQCIIQEEGPSKLWTGFPFKMSQSLATILPKLVQVTTTETPSLN
jgi:hypothetical protein